MNLELDKMDFMIEINIKFHNFFVVCWFDSIPVGRLGMSRFLGTSDTLIPASHWPASVCVFFFLLSAVFRMVACAVAAVAVGHAHCPRTRLRKCTMPNKLLFFVRPLYGRPIKKKTERKHTKVPRRWRGHQNCMTNNNILFKKDK